MFLSCDYVKYAYNDQEQMYKIKDSEFECELISSKNDYWLISQFIEEYNKRNLPIIPNLFRFILHLSGKHSLFFENIINSEKNRNIYFKENYYPKLMDMWNKYKAFL